MGARAAKMVQSECNISADQAGSLGHSLSPVAFLLIQIELTRHGFYGHTFSVSYAHDRVGRLW